MVPRSRDTKEELDGCIFPQHTVEVAIGEVAPQLPVEFPEVVQVQSANVVPLLFGKPVIVKARLEPLSDRDAVAGAAFEAPLMDLAASVG